MKPSDSIDTRLIEIELILQDWDGLFPDDCPQLDADYYFEDLRKNNLGLGVGDDIPPTGNINKAITDFFTPILRNAEDLKKFSPILKVKVYNKAYTCSMNIKCIPLINLFGAELDIEVYPTEEE